MTAPDQPDDDTFSWERLRAFTAARIGLGNVGGSLPTRPLLAFQLAHARARDAVYLAYDLDGMAAGILQRGLCALRVVSAAHDRTEYLKRPDLGRKLSADARDRLREQQQPNHHYTVAFVLADGLSALAVHRHALPLLDVVLPLMTARNWNIAPIILASLSRVALGDEIAALLPAHNVVMLIGERPGLSSPDSLGVYLTHEPRPGCTDAQRNCISNIRPEGLGYDLAGRKLVYLLSESMRRGLSGINLKDEFDALAPPVTPTRLTK